MPDQKLLTKKPKDEPFRQQKLRSWQFIISPVRAAIIFFVIGIAFVPTGTYLLKTSKSLFESVTVYDGSSMDVDCSISEANEGKQCDISITLNEDVTGPVYVYYELRNFYQNQRRYVASLSYSQLLGSVMSESELTTSCDPLTTNGSLLLNPCGLIANSFFTDVINFTSSPSSMIETNIAWASDRDMKFVQPNGFQYTTVPNGTVSCAYANLPATCKTYQDQTGQYYKFYYPNDDTTQYLYETYPDQISPIEGVTNEHFIVWMRTAGMPTFRKLYGKIDSDFNKGDILKFTITANYEVGSFDGTKALVLGTTGPYGGSNFGLGITYVVAGSISLFMGFIFSLRQLLFPRQLGDKMLLKWN